PELRPADDEDAPRVELSDRIQRLGSVDVARLDERGIELGRDVVERALPRALGIDRARQRHDSHDLGPGLRSCLEAVAPDRVEAHPDGPHRRAMLPSYSTVDGTPGVRPLRKRIQLCRASHTRRPTAPADSATMTIAPAPGTFSSLIPASPSTPARSSRSRCSGMERGRRPPMSTP